MKPETVTMSAKVCGVQRGLLHVCEEETKQEVLVHYDQACCFREGDRICIHYNGVMTRSMPPQIRAVQIARVHC